MAVISVFSQVEKLLTGLAALTHHPLWWVSHQRKRPGRFLLARWPSSSGLCRWLCQMPTAIAALLPLELSSLSSLLFLPSCKSGKLGPMQPERTLWAKPATPCVLLRLHSLSTPASQHARSPGANETVTWENVFSGATSALPLCCGVVIPGVWEGNPLNTPSIP